ncbi:hypothetical protein FHG87_004027 [Trinorchestia longiramus]|nr:hypothetical protein FHG87_004027 [Trinorchestia longiramus]
MVCRVQEGSVSGGGGQEVMRVAGVSCLRAATSVVYPRGLLFPSNVNLAPDFVFEGTKAGSKFITSLVDCSVFLKVVRTAPLGALRKYKGAVGGYILNGGPPGTRSSSFYECSTASGSRPSPYALQNSRGRTQPFLTVFQSPRGRTQPFPCEFQPLWSLISCSLRVPPTTRASAPPLPMCSGRRGIRGLLGAVSLSPSICSPS